MEWTIAMENYPEKLVNSVKGYLEEHKGSKLFHYDYHTSNMYKDKSISSTNYRAYILYGNLFEVMGYTTCSKPEWNFDEVTFSSMIAWEIKVCYEKGGWPWS